MKRGSTERAGIAPGGTGRGTSIEEAIEAAVSRVCDRYMARIFEVLRRLESATPPRMLTVAQAAEALGCCKGTVRRMVKDGRLTYKVIGLGRNGIRIDASSLHGAGGGAP